MEKTPLENRQKELNISLDRSNKFLSRSSLYSIAYCLLPVAHFLLPSQALAISVSVGTNPTPVFTKTSVKPKVKPNKKAPVLLSAENVDYDKDSSTVLASGKVEIVQGETIMLADKVTYDQANNVMTASGNVSILESSGNVLFADSLELKDDLKSGVIKQFKARLSDNSLFVANSAKKQDENITELYQAVYSPCKVCASKEGGESPLWQLHADHILINQQKQEVTYKNALMEIYGVPILYTPYFSHPTPGADNKSGLLEPTFKQSTNLGTVYKQPVYYSIAKDKDVTFTPIFTTLEGPVLAGEYRQLFNNGAMTLTGSVTKPQTRDAGGVTSKGQNWRGHFDGKGQFAIDDKTDWGFNIRRTSDDTYLRRYDFSEDSLLTSRIYAEKRDFLTEFSGDKSRSFASVQTLKFDGLTAADNSRTAPVILPLMDFNWESAPSLYNGRFSMDGNLMSLTRQQGAESRRISTAAGWKMPYITSDGQIIEFATQIRTDIYWVNDQPLASNENYNGQTGRVIPQASLTWRYPFINQFEQGNLLLEPIVMLAASPNSSNSNKIPNEDSQVPEFNTSNLFSPNRFAGYDRVETGAQAAYGLRGQAQIFNNKYIDWLVGQHYRQNTSNNFPYTNNSTSNLSDYVGKMDVYYDPFTISYRTRLDKDSLAFNQNEVAGSVNYNPIILSTSYLSLKNDPTLQNKEEISGTFGVNLTKQWNWGVGATRNLELGSLSSASTSLTFQNECLYMTNSFGRNYTFDRDIKPSTTYMFRVSFKNLD
jgi:LPS-assembly protein